MARQLRLVGNKRRGPARALARHSLWPLLVVAVPLTAQSRVLGQGSADDEFVTWTCPKCKASKELPKPAPTCFDCDTTMSRAADLTDD